MLILLLITIARKKMLKETETEETIDFLSHFYHRWHPLGLAHSLKTCFWCLDNPAMKLPWPFPHFVSSLMCPNGQGFDAVRTLYGQGGKGQFLQTSFMDSPL